MPGTFFIFINAMMHSGSFLLLTMTFGTAYTYFILRTHFLAVKLDKSVGLNRSKRGEIRIRDLKLVKAAMTNADDLVTVNNALFSLKVSNMLAVAYVITLIIFR